MTADATAAPTPGRPNLSAKTKKTLLILLQLAIGGLGGYLFSYLVIPKEPLKHKLALWQVGAAPLMVLLFCFSVIAVHELGHLVGGMLARMQFLMFIVGPLRVDKISGRLRVSWNRSVQTAGGLCGMAPADAVDLNRRMSIFVAGGPLASLLLTAVAGLAAFVATGSRDFWLGLTVFSGLIALISLLPMKSGNFLTDGARLQMLAKGGVAADRWSAMAALIGMGQAGVRPRDYPEGLVELVKGREEASFDGIGAALIVYAWRMDRDEWAEAKAALQFASDNYEKWPRPFHPAIFAEEIYFYSVEGTLTAEQEARWPLVEKSQTVEQPQRLRAKAALLAAQGKRSEAAEAIQAARALLAKQRSPRAGEEALLARIAI